MSLLDDVREMDCRCDASEDVHGDHCVLLIKPKIVAVLEAVDNLRKQWENPDRYPVLDGVIDDLMKAMES